MSAEQMPPLTIPVVVDDSDPADWGGCTEEGTMNYFDDAGRPILSYGASLVIRCGDVNCPRLECMRGDFIDIFAFTVSSDVSH